MVQICSNTVDYRYIFLCVHQANVVYVVYSLQYINKIKNDQTLAIYLVEGLRKYLWIVIFRHTTFTITWKDSNDRYEYEQVSPNLYSSNLDQIQRIRSEGLDCVQKLERVHLRNEETRQCAKRPDDLNSNLWAF